MQQLIVSKGIRIYVSPVIPACGYIFACLLWYIPSYHNVIT